MAELSLGLPHISVELDAVWRPGHGQQRRMVTLVGFIWAGDQLRAVAVPMHSGIPFDAPARQFEVVDPVYRKP